MTQATLASLKYFKPIWQLWALVFSATWLIYNIDREDLKPIEEKYVQIINLCMLFLLILSLLFLPFSVLIILFFLGILAFSYAIPKFLGKIATFSLRKIPLLKIFIVVFVWSSVSVLVPLFFLEVNVQEYWYWWVERALFLLAITFPFDMVDLKEDIEKGLKTWANSVGVDFTHKIALFFCIMFFFFNLLYEPAWYKKNINILIAFISFFLIYPMNEKSSRTYYKIYLDGTMALYGLLHWVLSFYYEG